MADVAALANVSGQTVSRVANGSPSVLPETRTRVLAAMDQLGYSPNTAARALRNGAFETIGVIAHKLSRTGESRTVEAVVEAARSAGHTVTLLDVATPSSHDVAEAASRLMHQAIDGLVIIRAEIESPQSLILPPRLPVVVSDSQFLGHLPTVGADQAGGARAAVEHLLGLGHATVHLLAGPPASAPATARRLTWEQTLVAHGREVPAILQGDWTAESGYAAARAVIDNPRVTAVFCANDEMAAGLMLALHEEGIAIPRDVSIVGFDNVPLSRYTWPPLTTVNQDFESVGKRLVEVLLEQITTGSTPSDHRDLIPADLVVRASTGAPSTKRNA
jgi:DNA-binding LacI/PurR family transcriptional regulator